MNKQELIDKLNKQLTTPSEGTDFDYGHDYGIQRAIYLAEDLDEQQSPINKPEKPVVPQFVADLYESIKDDFEYKVYELCLQYKHRGDELPQGVAWWFGDSRNKPIETLVMMHKFGYEVEKEKLYYVNIPNVYHGDFGYSETHDNYSFYNKSDASEVRFELTESEIKLEHEWAWQFAKEVEE